MSNQPTIKSEIEAVEIRVVEWKREMRQAESDFNMTKASKYLAQKLELANKVELAEKFLAQHRVDNQSKESQ